MPHVIVKLWPGKTSTQKQALADAIVRDVMEALDYGQEAVSVGFEEIAPEEWDARVVQPDVLGRWSHLTKQPDYGPRPSNQKERSQ